ncbi:serine hydrolase domain-containing protein [Sedimentitalea todarodis]|uniref:Serine hydrolase n=1 Tax=Sedimentitalea todarodis TaxID=1631240 RepID=A0ABU3VIA4_9RHOB|nr:serine hydrolase [Sedimentitalea todarodis]MDU9005898.1 serine hydrolase [Sedimentitalea todarodis]
MLKCLAFMSATLAAGIAQADPAALSGELQHAFDQGKLDGLHAVLVRQNGETLAEVYFEGRDERWGQPLGPRSHGPDTLHDLRSVSKSVTGLLYGIALDKGLVAGTDSALLAQFPEYADLATTERNRITIGDTLSMQMGTQWDETLPYTDPRNSEIAMELAEDRYRYVLEQPVVADPGTAWTYSGGTTALLGAIIARGAGMPLDQFARLHLFDPLGIDEFEWIAGDDGIPSAASGLRLSARDLARIGEMVAARGIYEGQQIVSADWLQQSATPRAQLDPLRYGYHWWLSPIGDPPSWIAGFGNGGQRLSISPRLGLVVVVYAGRYNDRLAWELPLAVVNDYVVPALGLR